MMSDLSNTLRNMKFMQRTSESRKQSSKKPSQIIPVIPSAPVITMPEHPGCWRIIQNELNTDSQTSSTNANHPSIVYRPSIFSIHERTYTRLSFQNYNKRIEPLMIKYGLKQDLNNLEDGEIDPDDEDEDTTRNHSNGDDKNNNEMKESRYTSTLSKNIKKKFQKKSFPRPRFDNKSRVTKRRRRTPRHDNSTN